MTPDPTLIEQLEALKEALAPLSWKDTVPDDLQSEVRMLFNEALAGGPNMNGDAGPTLTPNHAYDCILATERIATLQGSAALPSEAMIERTMSGETVNGYVVAAYRETHPEHGDKYGHSYSEHWSTPSTRDPRVKVERLFTETQLLAAMRAATPTAPVQDDDAEVAWLVECPKYHPGEYFALCECGCGRHHWTTDVHKATKFSTKEEAETTRGGDIYCIAVEYQFGLRLSPTPDTGLIEALVKCRDKFADYAELHRAKFSRAESPCEYDDIRHKIDRNLEMVAVCDTALANAAPAQVESGDR